MKRTLVLRVGALLLGAFIAAGGCASTPAAADSDEFKVEVDRIFADWAAFNLEPNLDGFVGMWDKEAVKMASGRATVVGPESIRVNKSKAFDTVIYDHFDIKIEEVLLLGEYGWARGTYLIDAHPKAGGQPTTDAGCFFTVFKKQPDGSWKVYRDTMMSTPR